ncbi:F-box/kelch-repeat protein At3g23880-like [Nicotiana tomentosiformis]|uniref:F-box/kelch-repeat protein At3g23880-like n=1 Tax=Nicotiana tomentosiformis TaxID=4098 RepID=UPI00388C671D
MKHQSRPMNDLNSKKFLVSQQRIGKPMYNFYCSYLSSVQLVEDVQKLDCPSNCKPHDCKMYCSCDGLVLLAIDEQLLLWNPSTRESIELPRSELTLRKSTCGLGYDATSDDYKILKINYYPKVYIEIPALKSGSWRKKFEYPGSRFDPMLVCMDSLAFVNGAFHWVDLKQNYSIVSFSISDEMYGEIPLLERLLNEFKIAIKHGVSILGGMLCYNYTHIPLGGSTFKLWVMKEYGVKKSWTELQQREPFFAKEEVIETRSFSIFCLS